MRPTTGESRTVLEVSQQVPEYEAWIRARYPELLIPTFSASTVKHGVVIHPHAGEAGFCTGKAASSRQIGSGKGGFQSDGGLGHHAPVGKCLVITAAPCPKDDGSWRPCGDFRRLNDITEPDKYPVPHIQDFSAQLAGRRIFSKIDLIRGYHQIPVAKQDVHKTAVITSFGLYKFLGTPFRLKNPAQAFQRLMDSVCRGLEFVFVYLDDILVASWDRDEHRVHLAKLFSRLKNQGLILNLAKCRWGQTSLRFLGHHVSADGIAPAADKVRAVTEFPQLKTPTPGVQWNGESLSPVRAPHRVKAFQATKAALVAVPRLVHFTAGAPLALKSQISLWVPSWNNGCMECGFLGDSTVPNLSPRRWRIAGP